MRWMKRAALVALGVAAVGMSGCSSRAMDNFDLHPADHGLVHALQSAGQGETKSDGYSFKVLSMQPLTLQILDANGSPVQNFTEDMTMLLHLIVVSRDLSSFAHLHPDYQGNGVFTISHEFPFGGEFQLIAEFVPEGKDIAVAKHWVTVEGATHQAQPVLPDEKFTKTLDGVEVTLTTTPDIPELKSGQMAMLNFHLADPTTHKPVKLDKYLGTFGHGVILNSEGNRYLHVHAMDGVGSGSDVMFHTEFPAPGLYKVWGQFQVGDEVIAAPFTVNVQ
ncbi:hypothetical protein JJB07_09710 [Tumebacillus sp. ITR2]|uniref:Secreted protein n=1 Tax=Tumebacillus amylolyticus TaxID=2801339 RepID=A0ABS1JA62_9BACL|nr:hypothetical protein [Tumebacillus amylolyticus]MBL0386929.1 hypothetical protein [Tumebacillus amylolyticus]